VSAPAMSPLEAFAAAIGKARRTFSPEQGCSGWLVFQDAKQAAYTKLVKAIPEVEDIVDFWRFVQNIGTNQIAAFLRSELAKLKKQAGKREVSTPRGPRGTITPLQAAKAHCANYQSDGSCLGIYYNDDLSIDSSRYEPRQVCLLSPSSGRCPCCPYFEEIVLPQCSPATARLYVQALPEGTVTTVRLEPKRLCSNCQKREPAPGKLLCAECAKERTRISKREHMKRVRSGKTALRKSLGVNAPISPLERVASGRLLTSQKAPIFSTTTHAPQTAEGGVAGAIAP
jgi:hypothetical protein